MGFNLVTNSEYCSLAVQAFLSGNVILYYSHIPTAAISLLLGFYIFIKNKGDTSSRLFFLVTVLFALWSFFDLILWSSADSRKTMFFWSIINLIENLVSGLTLYFTYVFLEKKDVLFKYKAAAVALFLPFLVLIPTAYNITGFNGVLCEAQQGILINYFYFLEGVFFIVFLGYSIRKILRTKGDERKQAVYFSVGAMLFLLSFSGANIAGSIASVINPDDPDNWKILQYGLFGMPVFLTFLTYLVVKYRAFNVQLLAAEAQVVALISLVGSQLFFIKTTVNFILTLITLSLVTGFGWFLIRSVQQEVKRKEELQRLSDSLAIANTDLRRLDNAKSEFVSIASHQLRTPLTAVKGFVSLLLEGAYGQLEPPVSDALNKVYLANNRLMNLVENLLNISRIEAGRIQYQFTPTRIEDILLELRDMFLLAAHAKGLKLGITLPQDPLPMLQVDGAKIREAISNIIDNSIKYTEKGEVMVVVERSEKHVTITVTDTGVGIDADDLPHIFKKFERGKDASKVNVSSTGLGLYVGKNFIEAHGGTITVMSNGKDRGTSFVIHLPIASA